MAGAKAPGHRGTALVGGRGAARHTNYAPLVAMGGAVVVLLALGAFFITQSSSPVPPPPAGSSEKAARQDSKFQDPYAAPRPPAPPPPSPANPQPPPTLPPPSNPNAPPPPPAPPAPSSWEPAAAAMAEAPPLQVDGAIVKETEDMLRKGETRACADKPERHLAAVINALISDDEALARAAFKSLFEFCQSREPGENPVDLGRLTSAKYRGGMFTQWAGVWYPRHKDRLARVDSDIDRVDWDAMMRDLRPAGGYHDTTRPEGQAMQRLKSLNFRKVCLKLATYIEDEDIGLGRAACAALEHLTGHKEDLPKATTRAAIKKKWDDWLAKN
jgi:hypothetical protein